MSNFRSFRSHVPWTVEEPPGHFLVREMLSRVSETWPSADSKGVLKIIDLARSMGLGLENCAEYEESDISSASGRSTSVPSPSNIPNSDPDRNERSVSPRDIRPETHRNSTYASNMHMFQFRKHRVDIDWHVFAQSLKPGLPLKLGEHNESFQLIDYGGSGIVYATEFRTPKGSDSLAIKVLRNKKADFDVRLPAELEIMKRLNHNHIVAFVGWLQREGQFAVLMYPVAICNLSEYLHHASDGNRSRIALDSRHSRTLMRAFGCLASALMYLHISCNVKHKDIKPENILVTRHESVILADFGISKQYDDNTITEGTTPFTDKYAPPEVVDRTKRDLSADIWSLGCVFLEMATVVLGETLESLSDAIYEANGRPNYRSSQPKVKAWIAQLKELSKGYGTQHPWSSF